MYPYKKNPFEKIKPKLCNARSKRVDEKKLFQGSWGSWRYKRCFIPANGFFEKGFRNRKKNYLMFWLAGIWLRYCSSDGEGVERFCELTTEFKKLLKPLHYIMPYVIANIFEEKWTENFKNLDELNALLLIKKGTSPEDWLVKKSNYSTIQMSFF